MRKSFLVGFLALAVGSATAYADDALGESRTADDGSVEMFFATDSDNIETGSQDNLEKIAKFAKCHRGEGIVLQGFADKRGGQAYNVDLSARRAAAVRESLMGLGVKPAQIVLEAHGVTTADTLAEARRVTVRLAGDDLKVPQGG